jgi:SAM-dependent methyltransferase
VLLKCASVWFKRRAPARIRRAFPGSGFVGSYEKSGLVVGIWLEQWLWAYRHHIRGVVLDMSTPRYWNDFVYQLPGVEKVLISDLCAAEVEKHGYKSKVDIIGDFCAVPPPLPPKSLDTVLCLSILEHCTDPFAMVRNLSQVLRPGGVAFLWCPFAYTDGHMHPDYWRFCRDAYLLMAQQAGLDVIETGEYDNLGRYYLFSFGTPVGRVPVANWMICRRPK